MGWKPTELSREQMEERRRAAAPLIRHSKLSHAAIARELGVSRVTVVHWARTLKTQGLRGLRRRKASGRPAKLTAEQHRELKRLVKHGALAAGFESDRWTLARVRQAIKQKFDVVYHEHYLGRLLRKLGLTPQVPLPRAVERDEALIGAWIAHDWPRIKKGAAQRRKHRVFR
jgi:transposase